MHRINRFPRFLWVVSLSLTIAASTPPLLSWFLPANQAAQAFSVQELRRNWKRLFETQPPVPPVPPTPSMPAVLPTPSAPPVLPKHPVPPVPATNGGGCCR